MSVELRTMRYVIAIAETGGFQLAAERLHMSQPPLSRQIRELERELGVTLFHRRPTRLTAEGHVFVRHARAVLADVERAVAETRGARGPESGTVRVGCGPMSGTTDIPGLVAAVRGQRPGIVVDVVELWDNDLAAALVAGEVDIAIGWHLSISGGLARHVLRREPYVVVLGEEHPLRHRNTLALSDLRGEIFRFLPRRFAPHYYDAVLAALRSTGEEFQVWENPLPGLRYFGDLATRGVQPAAGIDQPVTACRREVYTRDRPVACRRARDDVAARRWSGGGSRRGNRDQARRCRTGCLE